MKKRKDSKFYYVMLGIIVTASLLFRMTCLGCFPVRGDEGYSYYEASKPLPAMYDSIKGDPHPAGYYALLHIWLYLGHSEFVLRLFSVLAGTASVILVFFIGKILYSQKTGIIAALLLGLSQIHLRYSQNARAYEIVTLLVLASAYFFIRYVNDKRYAYSKSHSKKRVCRLLLRNQQIKHLALAMLFNLLCLYTHYYTLFFIAGQAVFLLFYRRTLLKKWAVAAVFMLLLFIPGLVLFNQQLEVGAKNRIEKEIHPERISLLSPDTSNAFLRGGMMIFHMTAGFIPFDNSTAFISILILALIITLVGLRSLYKTSVNALYSRKSKLSKLNEVLRDNDALMVIFVAVPFIMLFAVWFLNIVIPQTYIRYIIFVSPFYYILLARSFAGINKGLMTMVLLGFVFLNMIAALNYFQLEKDRGQWNKITDFVNSGSQEIILLHPEGHLHNFMYYYSQSSEKVQIFGAAGMMNLSDYKSLKQYELFRTRRRVTQDNACEIHELVSSYDSVALVYTISPPGGSLFEECLESEFVLTGRYVNAYSDIWGNVNKHIVAARYVRADSGDLNI